MEQHAILKNDLNEEIQFWIAWARKKADWVDPIVNADDELLWNVDRDKLLEKESMRSEPFRYG